MKLNPEIFKAYDVRGIYPDEVHEEGARAIGAAFVAYLKARRVGVGRDMRLSSPSLAAAFIDGATSQGADVVDYGISDIRDMIVNNRVPPPASSRGRVTTTNVLDPYVDHVMSFIDPSIIRP